MIHLAQIESVEPGHLRDAALILFGVLGAIASAVGIWAAVRKPTTEIGPQPLGVEIKGRVETQTPAWSASECASIHRSITEHLRRHDAEIAAIRAEAKADTDRVLSHVEEVRAELSGKMDDQAKEFGQAFRDMPNQIIALLRNTGALRK